MQSLPGALAAFAASEQFVAWYAWPSALKPGKLDKIPCHWATGVNCNAHDPAQWGSLYAVAALAHQWDRGHGSGVGLVLTANDPFFFLDIDGALGPDGQWSPRAVELCQRFAGAYVETSMSGRGLHIIGSLPAAPPAHSTRNTAEHLELYTSGRFVALTGLYAQGDPHRDCTPAFLATAAQLFPPSAVALEPGEWTDGPCADWSGPTDDDDLIRRMLSSGTRDPAKAFGKPDDGKITVQQLWAGEAPEGRRSECDQSLAGHLAFWTGRDCERIERLMRRSGLARDKWDSPAHVNYLRNTIIKACSFVGNVASDRRSAAPATAETGPADGGGGGFGEWVMHGDHPRYFEGCTFISDYAQVYAAGRNKLMKREAFEVEYGGHLFVLDSTGEKSTDSAYLAFTRSRAYRPAIVDDLCFRPWLAPGEIVREGDWSAVNTYKPYAFPRQEGDPSRFLEHLRRMVPDDNDRKHLLDYLAHMTQRPGHKVQWWPVLQGVKGNGKTLILRLMTHICGEAYTHLPNAAALARDGMKFNGWLLRKTFIGFEEVRVADRRGFLEELKPIVTNPRVPVEKKGVDSITGDNAANGIILTNYPDGVPIDDDERRYAIYFTAQQSAEDLVRDGMTEAYFNDLYEWCKGGGFAIVADWLARYPLPERMPVRAPDTTSKREAIRLSLGRIEQEVLDAIEEERPGFAGGFVSGKFLAQLIEAKRGHVPLNGHAELMHRLGYAPHPALPGGRTVDAVEPDNARVRLYLRRDHLVMLNVSDPTSVASAYSKAQGAARAAANFTLTRPS